MFCEVHFNLADVNIASKVNMDVGCVSLLLLALLGNVCSLGGNRSGTEEVCDDGKVCCAFFSPFFLSEPAPAHKLQYLF